MAAQILALAILVLTAATGIWKYFARVKSEKRKLADEARKKLDDAKVTNSSSDFLDAFGNARRL